MSYVCTNVLCLQALFDGKPHMVLDRRGPFHLQARAGDETREATARRRPQRYHQTQRARLMRNRHASVGAVRAALRGTR